MSAYTYDAHEAMVWAALRATGMLKEARVALQDCDGETTAWVDLTRPDVEIVGTLSTEWMIDYVDAELQGLAEDDEVFIAPSLFRVRQAPVVPDGGSGYWKRALLTRISEC